MTSTHARTAPLIGLLAASLWGCASPTPAQTPAPAAAKPAVVSTASPSAVGKTANSAPPDEPPVALPRPCGALGCLAFATPEAAFSYVLRGEPRVLAIGEAHAQQNTSGIRSSTRRFAEQFLPMLAGKSKHIVIELLVANCKAKTVNGVKKAQAPVTEHQAETNQNEFLTLGKYAQHLGIEPQALSPSCPEYDAVLASGSDSVGGLLTLIAAETSKSVEALLGKPDSPSEIVLTYGGALHNDLQPRPGQESWSFGPRLARASGDRYIELDLIVPEYVKDSDAWRALPWFSAFDREHLLSETLLFQPSPRSFALIFPKTDASTQGQL